MIEAPQTWEDLSKPWQAAFEEAWTSWKLGSLGIGAVLLDPDTNEIVSTGRNRTAEQRSEQGVLAGNFMAHAEMNAIAALPRFKADGLHLYTTLEPCLMCAATAIFMHVDTVLFASPDPYFEGLADLWDHHEYSTRWKNNTVGPLPSPFASFSMLLHLTRMTSDNSAFAMLRSHTPDLVDLSVELGRDGTLKKFEEGQASVSDVFRGVVSRIPS